MRAVIEHQARVLDPRALPDYLRELNSYVLATDPGVHGRDFAYSGDETFPKYQDTLLMLINGKPKHLFLQEGPSPAGALPAYSSLITADEFNRITSGAALGEALYPNAFNVLEKLGIRSIHRVKDLLTNHRIKHINTLMDLRNNLELICHAPVSFYAKINPPVALGTDGVSIEIDPLANALIYSDGNGSSWYFESQNPRAIKISAQFEDPKQAASGLKGLNSIFPDMVFTEMLLLNGLPKDVAGTYKEIAARNHAYSNYLGGLTDNKPDFDEGVYREMTSQASISLIGFLKPLIERLGIRPTRIFYYDERSNMRYKIQVDSLDEVAGLISLGYYDGTHIPVINAVFNGSNIQMEFPSWENGVSTPVAMQIRKYSKEGTLESILSGIRANSLTK